MEKSNKDKAILHLLQKAKYNGGTATFITYGEEKKNNYKRRITLSKEFFKEKTLMDCYNHLEDLKNDFLADKYVITNF